MDDKNIEVIEDQEILDEEPDRLSMVVGLISWIPDWLKGLMCSEDDADLLYLLMMWVMSILIIRKKNNMAEGREEETQCND